MPVLGVYIHYPWCGKLCPYCDFPVAVQPRAGIPHQAYLDAVLAELDRRRPEFGARQLVSIYFGGGTPSLWPSRYLAAAIDAVGASFPAAAEPEITLEANPRECSPANLAQWRRAGINRVSIGAQSFAPQSLRVLGRDHDDTAARAAVRAALDTGFYAVSVDLIMGVPGGAPVRDDVEPSIRELAALAPHHLSVYELTIKERTRYFRAVNDGRLVPLADDALAARYLATSAFLRAAGYEHYEISNYARPGYRAVHNSLYWNGGEYLGLGCGAASFRRDGDRGLRWVNERSAPRYLRAADPVTEQVAIDAGELAIEELWLGLRTTTGVPQTAFRGREAVRDWLLAEGLATQAEDRIQPTLRGFLFADQVARRVVGG